MLIILNSSIILENIADFQVDINKPGVLLCSKNKQNSNNIENLLKQYKINYTRFGSGNQFEIDCKSISAYDYDKISSKK